MPSRRVSWQSRYQALKTGQDMARRWGDGLQRLYHGFAQTPFAPPFLAADKDDPLLTTKEREGGQGEWCPSCPPLTRLAILVRLSARDATTREAIERWLVLCQQRTLRWAWMQGKPLIGGLGDWQSANVRLLGYTVDVPEDEAAALRHFWHHQLGADEVSAVDGEWEHAAHGISLSVRGSIPVFRAGTIMVSHKDDADAMHVTLSFPHTIDAGDIAVFGQAVMATSMMKKRRLGGRCYSLTVALDLLSYELTFESVADSDPGVTFIALLHAIESLTEPLTQSELETRCQGGLGLVSARYNKHCARFHKALLALAGQSPAVDFSQVTPASLSELACQVLKALKHPTLH